MNYSKETLELEVNRIFNDLGIVKFGELLTGGVVSDVFRCQTEHNSYENVVVKYTKSNIARNHNFARTDIENSFSKAPATHNLDILIQNRIDVDTPNIIKHFPDYPITIMRDFSDDGFVTLQTWLLSGNNLEKLGEPLGQSIATIRYQLETTSADLIQCESSQYQFDERFAEIKTVLYNGRMDIFNSIEDEFLAEKHNSLIWTDGDPKNIAVTESGRIIVYDFGRSIRCDAEFMLPNLLGHIALFIIGGYVENGIEFLRQIMNSFLITYKSYNSDYVLCEVMFINYFTAALLHRGLALRWIDPQICAIIGEDSIKNVCLHYADIVFDRNKPVNSIESAFNILEEIATHARNNAYKRPIIKTT